MGMIQQNYNMTDRVNYGADAKRFTHRRCKKLTSCQFLDGAKNNIMSKILVYSAIVGKLVFMAINTLYICCKFPHKVRP